MREDFTHQILALRDEVVSLDAKSAWMNISKGAAREVVAEWMNAGEIPLHDKGLLALVRSIRQTNRQFAENVGCWVHGTLTWTWQGKERTCPLLYRGVSFDRPNLVTGLASVELVSEWGMNPVLARVLQEQIGQEVPELHTLESFTAWWAQVAPDQGSIDEGHWLMRAEGAHEHLPKTLEMLASLDELGEGLSSALKLENRKGGEDAVIRTVVPCDHSQADVIASHGGLCVQGPPGCGKTQTVVNLIAHRVLVGEKVAVLCKKPSALRVIRKKLEEVLPGLPLLSTEKGDCSRQLGDNWNGLDAVVPEKGGLSPILSSGEIGRRLLELKKSIGRVHPEAGVSFGELFQELGSIQNHGLDVQAPPIPLIRELEEEISVLLSLPSDARSLLPKLDLSSMREGELDLIQGLSSLRGLMSSHPEVGRFSFGQLLGGSASASVLTQLGSAGRKRLLSSFDQLEKFNVERARIERRAEQIAALRAQLDNWKRLPNLGEVEGMRARLQEKKGWWQRRKTMKLFGPWLNTWPGEEALLPSLRVVERLHQMEAKQLEQVSLFHQKWGLGNQAQEMALAAAIAGLQEKEYGVACWLLENITDLTSLHTTVSEARRMYRSVFAAEPENLSDVNEYLTRWLDHSDRILSLRSEVMACKQAGVLEFLQLTFLDYPTLLKAAKRYHLSRLEKEIFGAEGLQVLNQLLSAMGKALSEDQRQNRNGIKEACVQRFREGLEQLNRSERKSWTLLRRQLDKKKNRLPVATWFGREHHKVGELLAPVFMGTPEDFAGFELDNGEAFDLLIIDEATQLGAAEILPPLHLSREVTCFGDSKQMSASSWMGTDALTFLSHRLTQKALQVHYRSQDGWLMDFSNRKFYEGTLSLPPFKDRSVLTRCVVAGSFENGVNEVEALKCIELAEEKLRSDPDAVVGIGCMSKQQADRVAEGLPDSEERCFVMNLENLQGVECDHLIVSTQYVAEGGKLDLRLGPLVQEGGDRRLNVLVTRARLSMTLVTSLEASQVPRTGNPGSDTLKDLLLHMESESQVSRETRTLEDPVAWLGKVSTTGVRSSVPVSRPGAVGKVKA